MFATGRMGRTVVPSRVTFPVPLVAPKPCPLMSRITGAVPVRYGWSTEKICGAVTAGAPCGGFLKAAPGVSSLVTAFVGARSDARNCPGQDWKFAAMVRYAGL